jgi:ribonuclease BN (tRNA processing enzyme)
MKLEVLGCYGNVTPRCRTSAFLINDTVLLDAGTVTEVLSPERLRRISHVCLSHVHLDHVKGLCCLAEEFSMYEDCRVTVLADEPILAELSQYVFNDVLWPDFTAIPDSTNPIVRLEVLTPLEPALVDGLSIRAIPVRHKVRTTGFSVTEADKVIMLTSDSGIAEQFWEIAQGESRLEFIVADVAFPDRLSALASVAGHMTLSVLLDQIDRYCLHHIPFYVAHMKSMFEEEIRREISNARRQNIRVLEQGSLLFV